MPVNASRHGSKPSSTSALAPTIAQIASGRRKGRMMTPAVAAAMMLQAKMASDGTISPRNWKAHSAAIAEADADVFPAGADGYLRFAASRPELQPTMLFNSPRHRRLCRDRL